MQQTTTLQCECVAEHRPSSVENDVHHIHPLGEGGPDTPDNRVVRDPALHRGTHRILRFWKKVGRKPSQFELKLLFNGQPVPRQALLDAIEGARRMGWKT